MDVEIVDTSVQTCTNTVCTFAYVAIKDQI